LIRLRGSAKRTVRNVRRRPTGDRCHNAYNKLLPAGQQEFS